MPEQHAQDAPVFARQRQPRIGNGRRARCRALRREERRPRGLGVEAREQAPARCRARARDHRAERAMVAGPARGLQGQRGQDRRGARAQRRLPRDGRVPRGEGGLAHRHGKAEPSGLERRGRLDERHEPVRAKLGDHLREQARAPSAPEPCDAAQQGGEHAPVLPGVLHDHVEEDGVAAPRRGDAGPGQRERPQLLHRSAILVAKPLERLARQPWRHAREFRPCTGLARREDPQRAEGRAAPTRGQGLEQRRVRPGRKPRGGAQRGVEGDPRGLAAALERGDPRDVLRQRRLAGGDGGEEPAEHLRVARGALRARLARAGHAEGRELDAARGPARAGALERRRADMHDHRDPVGVEDGAAREELAEARDHLVMVLEADPRAAQPRHEGAADAIASREGDDERERPRGQEVEQGADIAIRRDLDRARVLGAVPEEVPPPCADSFARAGLDAFGAPCEAREAQPQHRVVQRDPVRAGDHRRLRLARRDLVPVAALPRAHARPPRGVAGPGHRRMASGPREGPEVAPSGSCGHASRVGQEPVGASSGSGRVSTVCRLAPPAKRRAQPGHGPATSRILRRGVAARGPISTGSGRNIPCRGIISPGARKTRSELSRT
ncbi:MAG: hypothetical protein FJX19_01870 [Alphaproteobacteria bacterium]|nr:hypothetical protein [Alphaproteobacteria bacterium]